MNDKSVKQAERLILIATIIIFILIFFLKNSSSRFALQQMELPLAAAAPAMEQLGNENHPAHLSVLDSARQENVTQLSSVKPSYLLGETYARNLRVQVQVVNRGATSSSNIRLEIPLLANLDSPYQVLLKESFSPEPLAINEFTLGNRTASFKIPFLAPGEDETITVDYFLQVTPFTANISNIPETFEYSQQYVDPVYLLPADKIESDHPEIADKAREITAGLKNELEKAGAIFKYVITHMKYDPNSPYRNSGALSALRERSGVCEDFAALFVALCRSEGIPARIVNGYADPQGRGEMWNVAPGKVFSLKGYRHSWAEFYLAGTGWIPVDPTMNIYDRNLTYFASLPRASHLAQNYQDQNMRVRYQGGKLAVIWIDELAG